MAAAGREPVVADAMDTAPPVVESNVSVEALARRVLAERVEAFCVVDEGRPRGVVTAADIIFRQRPLHQPAYLVFLDAVVPLRRAHALAAELQKAFGEAVVDVMTAPALTTTPEASLGEAVRQMVDGRLSILPVIRNGKLVGALTRASLLRHMIEGIDRAES